MTSPLSIRQARDKEFEERNAHRKAYEAVHPKCPDCIGAGFINAQWANRRRVDSHTTNPELVDYDVCPTCEGTGMANGAPRWTPAMMVEVAS